MSKSGMNSGFSEEDWLNKLERKSDSTRTRKAAKTSLKIFDLFCKSQGLSRDQVIKQYLIWYNPKPSSEVLVKPDTESICLSLDRFVNFLNKDNNIDGKIYTKKSSETILSYFGFVKSYLRICHKIKLPLDDVKDYITFPKKRQEPRVPLELKQLKKIVANANAKRSALYYILATSGMRLGEALTLRPNNFHLDESPVRITLKAENTKTKEGRDCYISREAVERVSPLIEDISNNEEIFNKDNLSLDDNVCKEGRLFRYLCNKLGYTEKYDNSCRHVITLHSMRAYFHTRASEKHGTEYANALDGHSGYLEQYYRLNLEERGKKYQDLESDLLIESVPVESNKTKDRIITSLQEQMLEMQEEMKRMQKTPDGFDVPETA